MNRIKRYTYCLLALLAIVTTASCATELEEPGAGNPSRGIPAVMEVTLQGIEAAATGTRITPSTTDLWSVAAFDIGDRAAFYTQGGIQNPDDPDDFSFTASNMEMFCQNKSSSTYRFGNSDVILDPLTLGTFYSRLFYPYYADMPEPTDTSDKPGINLRVTDGKDGIEKCVDFMMSSTDKIAISNGAISPQFQHNFCPLYVVRGEGFRNAPDKRIWIVMREPFTDVRVTQDSPTSPYSYKLQYNPEESEEDVMTYILPGISKFKVNKYCLWETWEGANSATNNTRYTLIPTGPSTWQKIYFVYIQDDYGNWQNVDDFYLYTSGSKQLQTGYYYTLTISLKGVDVVARPISVQEWNDEIEITDNRKMGINDYVEYASWVRIYNSYVEAGRPRSMEEELSPFGEAVYNTATEYTSWTFLINHDIKFENKTDFVQIKKLEDALEGTSSYTRYKIINPAGPLVEEMTSTGALRSLEMNELYFIQADNDSQPYSPLIRTLNGGTIENVYVTNSIMVTRQPVGMAAGRVDGGVIKDCVFSGDVIGTESVVVNGRQGLIGEAEAMPEIINVNTSSLQFIEN